jgi:hypothetical protein
MAQQLPQGRTVKMQVTDMVHHCTARRFRSRSEEVEEGADQNDTKRCSRGQGGAIQRWQKAPNPVPRPAT